ncbi:DHH family phosphoesterase [bacterium]|nr:DHH family phosphoesterase [bacterium]
MKVTKTNLINFQANKMSQMQANYFATRLKNANQVDIICHESPDRDTINSGIVLQDYLNRVNVKSQILIDANPSRTGIKKPDFHYKNIALEGLPDTNSDTVIALDFSAKERVRPNVLQYMQSKPNILCIDHHQGINLFTQDCLVIEKPIQNADEIFQSAVPCYVDSSALSATSILYRLYEALDEEITPKQAYSIMFGLVDDTAKRGYLRCDGTKGTIEPTRKLKQNKNAYEIFKTLKNKLDDDAIKRIAQSVDIMSNLSLEEQKFYDGLYDKIQYSPNGKIAYIEIPPNDPEWAELGSDNHRTHTILNRFRQDMLNNKFHDAALDNIEMAAVFYPAQDKYKMSAHTKHPVLLKFFKYIERLGNEYLLKIANIESANIKITYKPEGKGIANFTSNAGGHPDRGGGKIFSTDPNVCHKWVQDIMDCCEFYDDIAMTTFLEKFKKIFANFFQK